MRFLTSLLSAIAGVFRRGSSPDPGATIELRPEDIEIVEIPPPPLSRA